MVREGRVLISSVGDPDFGSNYYVKALEVGAIVSATYDGTGIPVDGGHGFAALDKFLVLSEFPAMTKYGTVTGTSSTKLDCATVSVAVGDVLINLGQDTGVPSPNFDGNGLSVFTDMDYGSQANAGGKYNTVQCDSNGRYRYFYNNIPIWELVLSSLTTPFTAYLDTGLSGVGGAASSTDHAVVRWDGITGTTLQDSTVIVTDAGNVTGVLNLTASQNLQAGNDVIVGQDLTVGSTTTLESVTVNTTLSVTGASVLSSTLGVTGAVSLTAGLTVGTTLGVTGATSLTSGSTSADWTFGDASTDTYTYIGRLVVRTIAVNPTSSATAGTVGEIVYSSSTAKFYGKHTGTASDTNWRLLGT